MTRLRIVFALVVLSFVLGLVPAYAQTETTPAPAGPAPAVVVDESAPPPAEHPWTFRYLVPTVLALSGLALLGTFAAYGIRVRGRYRVAR